jgi:exopolysaccharide biosynthesis polyprenyl glycosylphosphotransferase
MFHRKREFLKLRLAATDAVVTIFAFIAAYVLRENFVSLREFYLLRPAFLGLLSGILAIWLFAGLSAGLYRSPEFSDPAGVARNTIRQTLAGTAALAVFLYLLKLGDVSRLFMLLFVLLNTVFLMIWRLAAPRLIGLNAAAKRHYVIVGTGVDAARFAQAIEADRTESSEILALISAGSEDPDPEFSDLTGRGARLPIRALDELTPMLRERVVDEVIFATDPHATRQLEELFLICEEEGIKVRVVVNFFPGMISHVSLDKLHDLPLLTFSSTPDNDYLLFLKRLFDLAIACAMTLVFAPLSLPVIIAIRLSSKGPVLFSQERCGLNGRRFRLYKFRSMYQDAELRRAEIADLNEMDGPVFKCANDPRITPVGKYLRKFSIDEWPQIFNVIRGHMSLVGPRPPLPDEVREYKPWQRRRLRMKPGLTCLWVLEGRNSLDFTHWMQLDMRYIDDWSLGLDCRILLRSIGHVLSGKGL